LSLALIETAPPCFLVLISLVTQHGPEIRLDLGLNVLALGLVRDHGFNKPELDSGLCHLLNKHQS
jgi:hypothetical protein